MRYLTSRLSLAGGLTAFILYGCASQYCDLSPEQAATVVKNVQAVIAQRSDNEVAYQLGFDGTFRPLRSDDPSLCFVGLEPRALREGHAVLDGELAVYFDRATLEVTRVADVVY